MIESPYATQFTREGTRNMHNRKPYRTKKQKAAMMNPSTHHYPKRGKDGAWRSLAPVTIHPAPGK